MAKGGQIYIQDLSSAMRKKETNKGFGGTGLLEEESHVLLGYQTPKQETTNGLCCPRGPGGT